MTSPRPRTSRKPAAPPAEAVAENAAAPPPAPPAAAQSSLPLDRIGDVLKRTRERRGDDLEPIAEYLCIRPNFLRALEDSRYDDLPADAYVIGFLRSYANLLGLDGREAIDRYRREMAGRRKKPALHMPIPVGEGRTPSVPVMIAAALAALLVYGVWYGISASDRAVVTTAPPLPTVTAPTPAAPAESNPAAASFSPAPDLMAPPPAPLVAPQKPATQTPTPSSPPAAAAAATPTAAAATPTPAPPAPTGQVYGENGARLQIRAEKESWISVTDERGRVVFDRVLKTGDIYRVPEAEGLRLTTGNATALKLVLDGADLPKFPASSRVLRGYSLDINALKPDGSNAEE